jgi:hypothetical protein
MFRLPDRCQVPIVAILMRKIPSLIPIEQEDNEQIAAYKPSSVYTFAKTSQSYGSSNPPSPNMADVSRSYH